MNKLLIKKGRVIDAKTKRDGIYDILIENGRVKKIEEKVEVENTRIINAEGLIIMPGLVDMHVHLREPGLEYKETIETGSKSAAAGGFTTIACMPNTDPVMDNAPIMEFINLKSKTEGYVKIKAIGAISKKLEGKELASMGEMVEVGAVAFSDDGNPVVNSSLMKNALEYASMWDKVIISHCDDPSLSHDGIMNEGEMSTRLGMKGIPTAAEDIMIARDIALAKYTGCRVHIAHVSNKTAVDLIRNAKAQGVKITAEVTPHHFSLTDENVDGYDTSTKVNPPLRSHEDKEAILVGLQDGTIDVIATDHAPHHRDEKTCEYQLAAFGISGLETALPLAITKLLRNNILTPLQLVEKMSLNPSRILNLESGSIEVGKKADITIFDENAWEKVNKEKFYSKGKNTPFDGMTLYGKVLYTIVDGKIIKNLEHIER